MEKSLQDLKRRRFVMRAKILRNLPTRVPLDAHQDVGATWCGHNLGHSSSGRTSSRSRMDPLPVRFVVFSVMMLSLLSRSCVHSFAVPPSVLGTSMSRLRPPLHRQQPRKHLQRFPDWKTGRTTESSKTSSTQRKMVSSVLVAPHVLGLSLIRRGHWILQHTIAKFHAHPVAYLLIPCIAALVGWFTNWLAVQMIFYPIKFIGIPIYRKEGLPLGLLGWQGIIPCKTRRMTETMVDMVETELLSIKDAFARIDPEELARCLAPQMPHLARDVLNEIPSLGWLLTGAPRTLYRNLGRFSRNTVQNYCERFVVHLTEAVQAQTDTIFNLRSCVVNQMMEDRAKLGELFRKCGHAELDFLVNSGLWFGFLLGIIQMVVALAFDNHWSLSIGGGIVGLATNWLALKWIFQPVDPISLGPLNLQGKFLRRQPEVAAEFSNYFANHILTSDKIWDSVLNDPETRPAFRMLLATEVENFLTLHTRDGLDDVPLVDPDTINQITDLAMERLPQYLPAVYPYMDTALGLEDTLRVKMEAMSSRRFERVLHPIFEEDELTLILAGAALGFGAGLVQQGLETGRIVLPHLPPIPRRFGRRILPPTTAYSRVALFLIWVGLTTSQIGNKIGRSRLQRRQIAGGWTEQYVGEEQPMTTTNQNNVLPQT